MRAVDCGAGGGAGPGECGDDLEDGSGVRGYSGDYRGYGAERDGESVRAEGIAGVGGGGVAFAGCERNGAGILLTQLKLRGIRTLASCVEEERQWRVASGEWRDEENREWKMQSGKTQDPPSKTEGGTPKEQKLTALAPWEVDWCEAVALLVGNEGAGLPEDVVHGADARIHIPMAGQVESLNAAAAAAVVLYEAFRQRKRKAVASG